MPRISLAGWGALVALLLLVHAAPAQDRPAAPTGQADPLGSSVPLIFGKDFLPDQPPPAALPEGQAPAAPPPADFGGRDGSPFSPFAAGVGHMPLVRADYRVTWFPDEHVSGQPTNLGYWRQDFGLGFPIYQDEANEWSASAHLRVETFHTGAILVDTLQSFPNDLWNIHFGTNYRHLFDNGWIAGVGGSFGSASDKPFHDWDVMTGGINAFLRIPQGDHNAWLFTLAYSPTNELSFPIPGVAFVWQPSEDFRAHIGLPFQLMWRPLQDLQLDLSYMLLRTVHARATYRLCDMVRLYTGFDWGNEAYYLADRPEQKDRFFYYDKRLSAGVLWNLSRQVTLDFSAGYVFDRFYFEGQRYSDRNFDRVDVGNGPYGSLQCLFRW